MKKLMLFAAAALLLFSCTPGEIVTPGDNNSNDKPATVQVTGITLDKTSLTIKEGESVTLTPTVKPDNVTNKSVPWTSGNEAVATVDNSGKVTGVKAGTSTITATTQDGGKTATCEVTVEEKAYLDAVDLGLSVKWAASNLCETGLCDNPWDYGDYYAWGETVPYYQSGHSQDDPCSSWRSRADHPISGYDWVSYKFRTSGDSWNNVKFSKYNTDESHGSVDNITELQRGEKSGETIDDVARAKLGGNWRMPTKAEWDKLIVECTWTSVIRAGVNGRLVTASNGNSIFLPLAGIRNNTGLYYFGDRCYYWSSSLSRVSYNAFCLFICPLNKYPSVDNEERYYGSSVRPVSE
ncbi:MAG: Ig-like domain-containing protein [Bacteroidales bacterium]|nr:Ig-like domain-containing protein [Bacteroidales bacterium]